CVRSLLSAMDFW
nr:immunoglobulin heavy chain junction region [Mus musculus]MBK4184260.1 immunoglobulin heavy chain junction region [Mus musculus]